MKRMSITLPPSSTRTLDALAREAGVSKCEIIRQAVALLNVAHRGQQKGLKLTLANDDDEVVGQIVVTI